eukprot:g8746.t1
MATTADSVQWSGLGAAVVGRARPKDPSKNPRGESKQERRLLGSRDSVHFLPPASTASSVTFAALGSASKPGVAAPFYGARSFGTKPAAGGASAQHPMAPKKLGGTSKGFGSSNRNSPVKGFFHPTPSSTFKTPLSTVFHPQDKAQAIREILYQKRLQAAAGELEEQQHNVPSTLDDERSVQMQELGDIRDVHASIRESGGGASSTLLRAGEMMANSCRDDELDLDGDSLASAICDGEPVGATDAESAAGVKMINPRPKGIINPPPSLISEEECARTAAGMETAEEIIAGHTSAAELERKGTFSTSADEGAPGNPSSSAESADGAAHDDQLPTTQSESLSDALDGGKTQTFLDGSIASAGSNAASPRSPNQRGDEEHDDFLQGPGVTSMSSFLSSLTPGDLEGSRSPKNDTGERHGGGSFIAVDEEEGGISKQLLHARSRSSSLEEHQQDREWQTSANSSLFGYFPPSTSLSLRTPTTAMSGATRGLGSLGNHRGGTGGQGMIARNYSTRGVGAGGFGGFGTETKNRDSGDQNTSSATLTPGLQKLQDGYKGDLSSDMDFHSKVLNLGTRPVAAAARSNLFLELEEKREVPAAYKLDARRGAVGVGAPSALHEKDVTKDMGVRNSGTTSMPVNLLELEILARRFPRKAKKLLEAVKESRKAYEQSLAQQRRIQERREFFAAQTRQYGAEGFFLGETKPGEKANRGETFSGRTGAAGVNAKGQYGKYYTANGPLSLLKKPSTQVPGGGDSVLPRHLVTSLLNALNVGPSMSYGTKSQLRWRARSLSPRDLTRERGGEQAQHAETENTTKEIDPDDTSFWGAKGMTRELLKSAGYHNYSSQGPRNLMVEIKYSHKIGTPLSKSGGKSNTKKRARSLDDLNVLDEDAFAPENRDDEENQAAGQKVIVHAMFGSRREAMNAGPRLRDFRQAEKVKHGNLGRFMQALDATSQFVENLREKNGVHGTGRRKTNLKTPREEDSSLGPTSRGTTRGSGGALTATGGSRVSTAGGFAAARPVGSASSATSRSNTRTGTAPRTRSHSPVNVNAAVPPALPNATTKSGVLVRKSATSDKPPRENTPPNVIRHGVPSDNSPRVDYDEGCGAEWDPNIGGSGLSFSNEYAVHQPASVLSPVISEDSRRGGAKAGSGFRRVPPQQLEEDPDAKFEQYLRSKKQKKQERAERWLNSELRPEGGMPSASAGHFGGAERPPNAFGGPQLPLHPLPQPHVANNNYVTSRGTTINGKKKTFYVEPMTKIVQKRLLYNPFRAPLPEPTYMRGSRFLQSEDSALWLDDNLFGTNAASANVVVPQGYNAQHHGHAPAAGGFAGAENRSLESASGNATGFLSATTDSLGPMSDLELATANFGKGANYAARKKRNLVESRFSVSPRSATNSRRASLQIPGLEPQKIAPASPTKSTVGDVLDLPAPNKSRENQNNFMLADELRDNIRDRYQSLAGAGWRKMDAAAADSPTAGKRRTGTSCTKGGSTGVRASAEPPQKQVSDVLSSISFQEKEASSVVSGSSLSLFEFPTMSPPKQARALCGGPLQGNKRTLIVLSVGAKQQGAGAGAACSSPRSAHVSGMKEMLSPSRVAREELPTAASDAVSAGLAAQAAPAEAVETAVTSGPPSTTTRQASPAKQEIVLPDAIADPSGGAPSPPSLGTKRASSSRQQSTAGHPVAVGTPGSLSCSNKPQTATSLRSEGRTESRPMTRYSMHSGISGNNTSRPSTNNTAPTNNSPLGMLAAPGLGSAAAHGNFSLRDNMLSEAQAAQAISSRRGSVQGPGASSPSRSPRRLLPRSPGLPLVSTEETTRSPSKLSDAAVIVAQNHMRENHFAPSSGPMEVLPPHEGADRLFRRGHFSSSKTDKVPELHKQTLEFGLPEHLGGGGGGTRSGAFCDSGSSSLVLSPRIWTQSKGSPAKPRFSLPVSSPGSKPGALGAAGSPGAPPTADNSSFHPLNKNGFSTQQGNFRPRKKQLVQISQIIPQEKPAKVSCLPSGRNENSPMKRVELTNLNAPPMVVPPSSDLDSSFHQPTTAYFGAEGGNRVASPKRARSRLNTAEERVKQNEESAKIWEREAERSIHQSILYDEQMEGRFSRRRDQRW